MTELPQRRWLLFEVVDRVDALSRFAGIQHPDRPHCAANGHAPCRKPLTATIGYELGLGRFGVGDEKRPALRLIQSCFQRLEYAVRQRDLGLKATAG